jgi:hypothetical protein
MSFPHPCSKVILPIASCSSGSQSRFPIAQVSSSDIIRRMMDEDAATLRVGQFELDDMEFQTQMSQLDVDIFLRRIRASSGIDSSRASITQVCPSAAPRAEETNASSASIPDIHVHRPDVLTDVAADSRLLCANISVGPTTTWDENDYPDPRVHEQHGLATSSSATSNLVTMIRNNASPASTVLDSDASPASTVLDSDSETPPTAEQASLVLHEDPEREEVAAERLLEDSACESDIDSQMTCPDDHNRRSSRSRSPIRNTKLITSYNLQKPLTTEIVDLVPLDMKVASCLRIIHNTKIAIVKFKVGISHAPWGRWEGEYWLSGYIQMYVLEKSLEAGPIEKLEVFLIKELRRLTKYTRKEIANTHPGANGTMRQHPPPYFTYLVVADDRMRQLEIARRRNYVSEYDRRKAMQSTKVSCRTVE